MATPSIDSTNVPDSMKSRGVYTFHRQEITRYNGNGVAIATGPQIITWRFSSLTSTELDWWITTIMSDAESHTITAAELWDSEWNEVVFTSGELYRPVPEFRRGGLFWNVEIRIRHLLPLV